MLYRRTDLPDLAAFIQCFAYTHTGNMLNESRDSQGQAFWSKVWYFDIDDMGTSFLCHWWADVKSIACDTFILLYRFVSIAELLVLPPRSNLVPSKSRPCTMNDLPLTIIESF